MKYTFDYIIENQDKILAQTDKQDITFKRLEEINALVNQNRIVKDFSKCKKFELYNRIQEFHGRFNDLKHQEDDEWQIQKRLWTISQEATFQLQERLKNMPREKITFDVLEPYIRYLSWNISVDFCKDQGPNNGGGKQYIKDFDYQWPCRWGYHRIVNDNEGSRNYWEPIIKHVYTQYEILDRYKKGETIKWDECAFLWHEVLGLTYVLSQVGLGEMAKWAIHPLYETFFIEDKINNKKALLSTIKKTFAIPYPLRALGHVAWAKAHAHLQVGEVEECYEVLDHYINFFNEGNLGHYLINNRVFEASILAYKIKPTEQNLDRMWDMFLFTCTQFHDEPTECAKERLLFCFDFIQTVFKKEYEEYNS